MGREIHPRLALASVIVLFLTSPAAAQAAANVSEAWRGQVRRGLAVGEYHPSRSRFGLQAPNRARNLRTYFEPAGIRVQDRTADQSPELLNRSRQGSVR